MNSSDRGVERMMRLCILALVVGPTSAWASSSDTQRSCNAAVERAVSGYLACLTESDLRASGDRAERLQTSCQRRYDREIRAAARRFREECPELEDASIVDFAADVTSGIRSFVTGGFEDLGEAVADAQSTTTPIPFDLQSGVSTITGPYPPGPGKCGADASFLKSHYPGFAMAAIPSAFFTEFDSANGNVSCDAELKVATDAHGEPLCYELSGGGIPKIQVVVADVCAGSCAQNVASCGEQGAVPDSTCGQIASCLDCSNIGNQFAKKWRCPPAMACFEQSNPGEQWQDWTQTFPSATLGITPTSECTVSGYIPTGEFPAFVDWCSGENAHFDVQQDPFTGSAQSPTVIQYVRIDCPQTGG